MTRPLRLDVPEDAAGARLDAFLAAAEGRLSRSAWKRAIEDGRVQVEGRIVAKPGWTLHAGARVEATLPDPEPDGLQGETIPLEIVYEDEHLVVVDKPAGLTMHAGAATATPTLAAQLLTLGARGGDDPQRPGIVHRLDRDTSGLLVAARSETAFGALQEMIRERQVERQYLALVKGRPRSRTGTIDAPIGRDRRDPTRRSLDTDEPRAAVTHFEARELLRGRTLLEVRLETGRTHQIRVHLSAIDLPVSGDVTYGAARDLGLERQFLHAHRLRFRHPVTDVELDLAAPLPVDLERALETARRS
jgi:23S rRNA pseudouridine1911/1915/1917 synthase